jgi:hypothetical protein
MIKSVQDYAVVEFILKDTIYHYDPEPFKQSTSLSKSGLASSKVGLCKIKWNFLMFGSALTYFSGPPENL